MTKITITGASDDLIEIDGDISEEWDAYDKGRQFIAVSDGTLLSIEYDDDGIWRVNKVTGGSAEFSKRDGDVERDTFDVVTLEGDIRWVALATAYIGRGW